MLKRCRTNRVLKCRSVKTRGKSDSKRIGSNTIPIRALCEMVDIDKQGKEYGNAAYCFNELNREQAKIVRSDCGMQVGYM